MSITRIIYYRLLKFIANKKILELESELMRLNIQYASLKDNNRSLWLENSTYRDKIESLQKDADDLKIKNNLLSSAITGMGIQLGVDLASKVMAATENLNKENKNEQ